MSLDKSQAVLGKDHFLQLYQTELEQEAEWLRRGAAEKANSIEQFLRIHEIHPLRLVELGCGVGAVITECQRRNLAATYMGVDYSHEAIDYLRTNSPGIEAVQGDITDPQFRVDGSSDIVVVSHVLEHLEEPARFLASMQRALKFSYVVIEVPLEDLMASRVKATMKDRKGNVAGHVQFFTTATFEALIESSGLRIVDRRTYVPVLDMDTIRFVSQKDGLAPYRYWLKALTNHYLPQWLMPWWKRLYYAHHAVLCTVR
ncbi:class I SAM-dependent methyltransferase [Sphaerotilus sp.]|uniref:class I SAM-dependent methyltransferase n=1 Tax=Sphaerotilus sp. TaxID=2093942 RepID=UPI00286E123C|nr:class I SAM-dependent methyltransferase [Sphaerotilus sp.]